MRGDTGIARHDCENGSGNGTPKQVGQEGLVLRVLVRMFQVKFHKLLQFILHLQLYFIIQPMAIALSLFHAKYFNLHNSLCVHMTSLSFQVQCMLQGLPHS